MTGSLLFPPPKPEGAESGLHQGEWWVDVTSRWHKIQDMPLDHVNNVMALLRSRVREYAQREIAVMENYAYDAPDGAYYSIQGEIAAIEKSHEKWLKSTQLYRALKKRRKKLRKAMGIEGRA